MGHDVAGAEQISLRRRPVPREVRRIVASRSSGLVKIRGSMDPARSSQWSSRGRRAALRGLARARHRSSGIAYEGTSEIQELRRFSLPRVLHVSRGRGPVSGWSLGSCLAYPSLGVTQTGGLMNRRDFVVAAGALAAAGSSRAASDAGSAAAGSPTPELVQLGSACVQVGELCEAHCFQLLATGDTSLANCARSANLMVAMCRSLVSASAQNSARLKEITRACGLVCRDCEAACKPHAGHHDICRRCMESCRTCATACEKASA